MASRSPAIVKQPSILDEETYKMNSVWQTLIEKASLEDYEYAKTETSSLYNNQPLATRSEILTWYLYDFANSPMFNVLLGLVIPIYISSCAIHYGCINETLYGCDYNNSPINSSSSLVVYLGAWSLAPASFTFTIISISGAIQAVSYLSIGALADYSYYQYYLFRICTLIASTMLIVFVPISSPSYLFAGWWIAFQLVFFGLALIFYNAYLPPIVENHWIIRRSIRDGVNEDDIIKLKQQLTDDMSQYGYATGYFGSLIMTIIAVIVYALMTETSYLQYTGYGLTANINNNDVYNDIQSFDEQWLKKVNQVNMGFVDNNLVHIQLFYDNMDIDGSQYGDISLIYIYSFTITDNDYIKQIEYWYNTDDTIRGMRFTTQSDAVSSIYGIGDNQEADEIMSGEDDNYIFAGYVVYSSYSNNIITGMDVILLNSSTGQFLSTWPDRLIILLVFFWWNCLQLLTFKYFRRRDGPPLPVNSSPFTFSILQFYSAIADAQLYPHLFRYLISWFLFSDGLNTMGTAAVLFATIELDFSSAEAALLLLETLLFGAVGGVLFLWIQRKILWNAKKMLLLHIVFFVIMAIYPIFGAIDGSPLGLTSKSEMYIFAIFYGLNFGSVQSYARSVFAYIVPVNKEAQMFALYEITDKGSSWIGPLLVGFIANTSSIRWGMFYVALFFAIPFPIILKGVSLKTGMKQAGRWHTADPNDLAVIDPDKEFDNDDNKTNDIDTNINEMQTIHVKNDDKNTDDKNNKDDTNYSDNEDNKVNEYKKTDHDKNDNNLKTKNSVDILQITSSTSGSSDDES